MWALLVNWPVPAGIITIGIIAASVKQPSPAGPSFHNLSPWAACGFAGNTLNPYFIKDGFGVLALWIAGTGEDFPEAAHLIDHLPAALLAHFIAFVILNLDFLRS